MIKKKRFTISKAVLLRNHKNDTVPDGNENNFQENVIIEEEADNVDQVHENMPLNESRFTVPDDHKIELKNDLYLYEEEMEEKPPATSIISALSNYQAAIPPNKPNASFQAANGKLSFKGGKDASLSGKAGPKQNKLGTMMGVFLPCIQNIFGVILFLRMNWIVGIAGAFQSVLIIAICCSITLLTAISMSAIATNGIVPAGGSYFMISRSLGPEFGGAVGFLFYLATTFAVAMYTIGAVEILLEYLTPSISIFTNRYHNFRVYGACFLLLMSLVVMVGVRLVNKIATISLFCVLLSILAIYVGIFARFHGNPDVQICLVGEQLIAKEAFGDIANCYKNDANGRPSPKLWSAFCETYHNSTQTYSNCNPYFLANNVTKQLGIPGLGSGVFLKNLKPKYMKPGDANPGQRAMNKHVIQAYIATSFMILLGIYFPSVTGIMAGSNRSGDLADAQNSIPKGTLGAITFTSLVYISSALLFAACISNPLLRDKFGASIGGGMIVANLGWPHPLIVTIGSFLSTIGAALQSLTGAPRLLQAISKDDTVPFLRWFTATARNGEPLAALALTFIIALLGIGIGNLDFIAPILTMFFLMCYGFVNLACALQTLLKTPNWRPRFKYYHWILSLIGLALCIAAMFISSWYYALVAMGIACALYKYIEYYGAEKEWGDGVKSLQLSTALYSLLRYEGQQQQAAAAAALKEDQDFPANNGSCGNQQHTKNWRPQLLVLCKFSSLDDMNKSSQHIDALNIDLGIAEDRRPKMSATVSPSKRANALFNAPIRGGRALVLKTPRLLSFASQLKAGHGLTVCATALQGDWTKDSQESFIIKSCLKRYMAQEKVKGFCDVVMAADTYTGIMDLIQLSGLGGLRHNAILIAWPDNWRRLRSHETLFNAQQQYKSQQPNNLLSQNTSNAPKKNQGQIRNRKISQEHEDLPDRTTDDNTGSTVASNYPSWKVFVDIVRAAHAGNMAIMVMKGCSKFPDNKTKIPAGGTIDVWWIVHDGGLLMLLPFLLKQNKVWKNCTTRIFTVAQFEDNSVLLKKNLENFIYSLRIKAQVEVVEMHKSDISAYTYERTLLMEQRSQLLRQLNLSRKESLAIVQAYADNAHHEKQIQQAETNKLAHHSSLPTSDLLIDMNNNHLNTNFVTNNNFNKKDTYHQNNNMSTLPEAREVDSPLNLEMESPPKPANISPHKTLTPMTTTTTSANKERPTRLSIMDHQNLFEPPNTTSSIDPTLAPSTSQTNTDEFKPLITNHNNQYSSSQTNNHESYSSTKNNTIAQTAKDVNLISNSSPQLNTNAPSYNKENNLKNIKFEEKGNGDYFALNRTNNNSNDLVDNKDNNNNNNSCNLNNNDNIKNLRTLGPSNTINDFTFTAGGRPASPFGGNDRINGKFAYNRINTANVKRMHAAIKLNEAIKERSQNAQLVMLNMPGPPRNRKGDENYMEYLEVLTEGLERVLLIRGSGQEVVTIYS